MRYRLLYSSETYVKKYSKLTAFLLKPMSRLVATVPGLAISYRRCGGEMRLPWLVSNVQIYIYKLLPNLKHIVDVKLH